MRTYTEKGEVSEIELTSKRCIAALSRLGVDFPAGLLAFHETVAMRML